MTAGFGFPLQFNYIPYPLWRRRWPFGLGYAIRPISRAIYPVTEDRHPPQDAATLADYLLRYDLLPDLTLKSIYRGLQGSTPIIEASVKPTISTPVQAPIRIPAQWEPMEAVMVNWPILYPPLWELHAQMVEAIAPVANVIVNIPAPMWANAAWLYLTLRQKLGGHIQRVRFLSLPVDDIWVRDHGPIIGYAPQGGRVALNAIYDHLEDYPQQRDNSVPGYYAHCAGLPLYDLNLHTEGGNLWTDGAGTLIMTEQIFNKNPGYSRQSLEDHLHTIVDFEKLIITPRLNFEETGHVDLLMKLASADTILTSTPYKNDEQDPLRRLQTLFRNETNAAGQPYNVVLLPRPPVYVNWFTFPIHRSYTNSLTVNGRVLVPVYGIREDETALRIYQEALPEHEVIPIDCKIGVNGGGAVHCLTKEIPAPQP